MTLRGIKQVGQATTAYGIRPAQQSAGGDAAGGFQKKFGQQMDAHYQGRAAELFDELAKQADGGFAHMDIAVFENYRGMIKALVDEVVNHAFTVKRERVMDQNGRQRIYATVKVIDDKLEEMAAAVLNQHSEQISLLSAIDELRGLVMDVILA